MSYAQSAALQTAVYGALSGDPALGTLVSGRIFDATPSGKAPDLYVSLGTETATDASDKTGHGALHKFTISVISATPGFARAKEVAAAICDVLIDADLTLSRGALVFLRFERAVAARADSGNGRRIDLRFRARVEDN